MIRFYKTAAAAALAFTFLAVQPPAAAQNSVRPQPTASPTPAVSVQTLAELQSRIRERLARPEVRRGQVGVKVVSLSSGTLIFEENPEKYFMPASNMKNFTVAAALEKLGPDHRFVTSVYAPVMPDPSGTIRGNMRIFGRGDVSLSTAFFEGDYFKGLDNLADAIAAAGVKRVEGDLVGDDSYFRGASLPGSWEWDDLQWYYGAEVSALPLNDNAVDLKVKPGPAGYPCAVTLLPGNIVFRVVNQCTTAPAGSLRTLKVEKQPGQNHLVISGNLPVGNNGFEGSVTVSRPADLFVSLLKDRLEKKGVVVTGNARSITAGSAISPVETVEIAKLQSPPLSLIAAKTMKPSQNMYTETLLRTLGEYSRARIGVPTIPGAEQPARDSENLGIAEVKNFLTGIGIPEDGVIQYDGSGLSRHNLITPSAVVTLYTYMAKQSRNAQAWRDSLTIGGVDGTLRNRFKGTKAAGNARGKTGTINQVSALSGYVTTTGGEELVFSLVVNGVPETRIRTGLIDEIVVQLANFEGKINQP